MKHVQAVKKNGKTYKYFRPTGARLPSDVPEDHPMFMDVYSTEMARHEAQIERERLLWKADHLVRVWSKLQRKMLDRARKRAKDKGFEFGINKRDIRRIIERQSFCCALTGVPFDLETAGGERRPFAPSIDRIDCSGGYTPGNVRLVCQVVNYALNVFGDEVFYKMCRAAVEHEQGVNLVNKPENSQTHSDNVLILSKKK